MTKVRLTPLILIAAFMVGRAAAQEVDARGDKELTILSQKIDKTAANGDAGGVTARIVDEWKGTTFKLDATSPARALTAQDVQNLRAKGLGFGEISILIALTAKQPNPATAKSVNDVLGMRRPREGWGKIAWDLGYRNLGSIIRSVKAIEKGVTRLAAERSQKPEKPGKPVPRTP